MTSAAAVSYFETSTGQGFALGHPDPAAQPVTAIEIANDGQDLNKIRRTLGMMQERGLLSAEQLSGIMGELRKQNIANDNPKSWVDRVSSRPQGQLGR